MAGGARLLVGNEHMELARAVFQLAETDRGPLVAVPETGGRLPTAEGGPWLTVRGFAQRSGIPAKTVGSYVAEGTLKAIRVTHKNHRRLPIPETELARTPVRTLDPASGWITPREFALRAGVTHGNILRLIEKGKLTAVRRLAHSRRGHWFVAEHELDTFAVDRRRRHPRPTLLHGAALAHDAHEDETATASQDGQRAA